MAICRLLRIIKNHTNDKHCFTVNVAGVTAISDRGWTKDSFELDENENADIRYVN